MLCFNLHFCHKTPATDQKVKTQSLLKFLQSSCCFSSVRLNTPLNPCITVRRLRNVDHHMILNPNELADLQRVTRGICWNVEKKKDLTPLWPFLSSYKSSLKASPFPLSPFITKPHYQGCSPCSHFPLSPSIWISQDIKGEIRHNPLGHTPQYVISKDYKWGKKARGVVSLLSNHTLLHILPKCVTLKQPMKHSDIVFFSS